MRDLVTIFFGFGLMLFFSLANVILYRALGGHSVVPLIICIIIIAVSLIITIVAVRQTIKHQG